MKIGDVQIVRVAQGQDAAAWARALGADWTARARVLKEEGPSWVRAAGLAGSDAVVKCRPAASPAERFKAAVGRTRLRRQWIGAAILAAKKVPTAAPLALARASVDGRACELLALRVVRGPTLLQAMREAAAGGGVLGVRAQHALARAVGEQVARLLSSGYYNRDHKPSNLIVTEGPPGGIRERGVAVIDCVAIRRALLPERDLTRMLTSLVLEPMGCGCMPRRALLMRGLLAAGPAGREGARLVRDRRWRDVNEAVRAHGDPRPRVDPLVQPGP